MGKDYVWQDINYKRYTLQEIDNKYLFNILRFISNGGGYCSFLDSSKIEKLFNEAQRRKIQHNFTLKQLINAFEEKLNYWVQEEDW